MAQWDCEFSIGHLLVVLHSIHVTKDISQPYVDYVATYVRTCRIMNL